MNNNRPPFWEMMRARWDEGKFVCVGLDSDTEQVRKLFPNTHSSTLQVEFNRRVVEETKDVVCAYKPNHAFYGYLGTAGAYNLAATIKMINEVAPNVPVILDAKRGDIGKSNAGYVREAFECYGADAVTVHPYLGMEAMMPFLAMTGKGIIVLCRTSNPGAGEFQDLPIALSEEQFAEILKDQPVTDESFSLPKQIPLFQYVAWRVASKRGWNKNGNVGIVAGATYPEELKQIREVAHDIPILIPGIGTQGGDLEKSVEYGRDSRGQGFIINSSSGIIFPKSGTPREALTELHAAITNCMT